MLSGSTAITFLGVQIKRLLRAYIYFPSLQHGLPSAPDPETKTLCWAGWLSCGSIRLKQSCHLMPGMEHKQLWWKCSSSLICFQERKQGSTQLQSCHSCLCQLSHCGEQQLAYSMYQLTITLHATYSFTFHMPPWPCEVKVTKQVHRDKISGGIYKLNSLRKVNVNSVWHKQPQYNWSLQGLNIS